MRVRAVFQQKERHVVVDVTGRQADSAGRAGRRGTEATMSPRAGSSARLIPGGPVPPVPTYSVARELLSVPYAGPTSTPLMAVQAVAMEDTSIGDGPRRHEVRKVRRPNVYAACVSSSRSRIAAERSSAGGACPVREGTN